MRRLLSAQVGIAYAPTQAMCALGRTDVVLLEDRNWPAEEEEALSELRELSAAGQLPLILSRRRGDAGERTSIPVVERPYRIEEIASAMRLVLLRRFA